MKNETEKKKSEKKNHPQISTPVDEKASCCSYLKTNLHPGNIQHIQHRDKSRLAMPDPFPRRKHGYLQVLEFKNNGQVLDGKLV